MRLSVIIPVYNEDRYIKALLDKVCAVKLPFDTPAEIIVVDDGSTDKTAAILGSYAADGRVKVISLAENKGKSSAVKEGIIQSKGDIILIQDADLEYDPGDYHELLKPIISGMAPVVYGSRFRGRIKKMSILNRIANILSNFTLNLLFNSRVTDVNTCYKVFRKDALLGIEINSDNFMFETELTAKLLRKGYHIYEVPIAYVARTKKEGKKISLGQALEMYYGIIKYRFCENNPVSLS